jgi:hypothetical protein
LEFDREFSFGVLCALCGDLTLTHKSRTGKVAKDSQRTAKGGFIRELENF